MLYWRGETRELMPNFLANLLNFSRFKLWTRTAERVIGVDVGSSSIKVVQLRREKGQVILETYGEMATGPYRNLAVGQAAVLPPDKLTEVTHDLFREANVTTPLASLAIPLGSSLLIIVEIPRVGPEMLAKVIPIEARKYIPVPISEVALDWWVIPKPRPTESEKAAREAEVAAGDEVAKQSSVLAENKLEVLVVAIHNAVISQYQNLCQSLGLTPAFFEIETFSAIRSVYGGEAAPTVILDLGAGTTKLAIVDSGIVRLSHTIAKGAQDITVALSRSLGVDFAKAEEIKRRVGLVERYNGQSVTPIVSSILEYIFSEVNKALTVYQAKQKRAVNKIVLIGGGALLRGLLELAGQSFEVPVTLGRPFDKTRAPAFLENLLAEAGPGFSVAIGLALRHLQSLD